MKNALADLQAWQVPHPPCRGSWFFRPRVHSGFLKSWIVNDFHSKVVKLVHNCVYNECSDETRVKILVTGDVPCTPCYHWRGCTAAWARFTHHCHVMDL